MGRELWLGPAGKDVQPRWGWRGLTVFAPCPLPLPGWRVSGLQGSAAAVPAHEGMAPHLVLHLSEGQRAHRHLAGTQSFETALLIEGHEEMFAHEHGAPGAGQAAQVLQVSPHQDGTLALLTEGSVHGQHVDVHRRAPRLVQGQRRLQGANGAVSGAVQGNPSLCSACPGSGSYLAEPVLVPQGADDEGHQAPFLEPAEGKLRAQRQEMADLIQVQRAVTGDGDEGWKGTALSSQLRLRGEAGWEGRWAAPYLPSRSQTR